MTRNDKLSAHSIGIRLSIWSIRNQSWLSGNVRIYIYAGMTLIAYLALAGVISIETALLSTFCGGLIAMGLIWTLIQKRKSILLNIQEPEVRAQAYNAMLAYIHEVDPEMFAAKGVKRVPLKEEKECVECSLT